MPTASTVVDPRRDEAHDHVDIVDHQVEDHIDLDAARLPRRDAVALEIKRIGDESGERAIGAGKALDLPHLKNHVPLLGELGERGCALEGLGDRLLDEYVDAGLDQRARDLVMQRGRNRHARGIDAANDAAVIEGGLGTELGGYRPRALFVGIDHRDELGARIARIVIGVKAPEIASSYNGDADLV